MNQEEKTAKIRELNDQFRKTFNGGSVMLTRGVKSLEPLKLWALFDAVQEHNAFSEDNDPHKEHDFGSVIFDGMTYFWKIDYYDIELEHGSEDPSDPSQTTRVMTIMEASEY